MFLRPRECQQQVTEETDNCEWRWTDHAGLSNQKSKVVLRMWVG